MLIFTTDKLILTCTTSQCSDIYTWCLFSVCGCSLLAHRRIIGVRFLCAEAVTSRRKEPASRMGYCAAVHHMAYVPMMASPKLLPSCALRRSRYHYSEVVIAPVCARLGAYHLGTLLKKAFFENKILKI